MSRSKDKLHEMLLVADKMPWWEFNKDTESPKLKLKLVDSNRVEYYTIEPNRIRNGFYVAYVSFSSGGSKPYRDWVQDFYSAEEAAEEVETWLTPMERLKIMAQRMKADLVKDQVRKNSRRKRAKKNPLGMSLDSEVLSGSIQLVQVGNGIATHILDPKRKKHLCRSGINAGRGGPSGAMPKVYKSDAKKLTCVRCQKMATMNMESGRAPWDAGGV